MVLDNETRVISPINPLITIIPSNPMFMIPLLSENIPPRATKASAAANIRI